MPTLEDESNTWRPLAGPPQRYSVNYERYVRLGGMVNPDLDAQGFAPGGQGDAGRFFFFCLMLDQIAKEGLKGDLAELGVYKGHTACLLANIARRLDKTAYLFDTFEGFDQADLQGVDAGKSRQFHDTSLEAVKALVGEDHVAYVQGYFPGSAVNIPDDRVFCLVHIDCDLYAPALSALEYFYQRMVPGGFIIIHDYSSLGWRGAEQAVDEFFADKAESVIPLPDSAGSAVIRKAKSPGALDNWRIRKNRRLFAGDWVAAAGNGLAEALGSGWSVPESWGVWGVGGSHQLLLYPPSEAQGVLEIDFDVRAPVTSGAPMHEVEVFANGSSVAKWFFDENQNRGVRTISVSASIRTDNPECLRIEFRTRSPVIPHDLNPLSTDMRPLGIALSRLRIRQPAE